MIFVRRAVAYLPGPIKALVFNLGNRLKQDVFGLPDAMEDFRRIAKLLNPEFILDIGAHIGEFTALIRKSNPNIPFVLFEPTPSSIAALRGRFKNDDLVKILPLGVSDKVGQERFFLNNNEQTNSMLDNDSTNKKDFEQATTHCQTINIDTINLDTWWRDHAKGSQGSIIIKADIQGAELKLIDGGIHCLSNAVAAIYTEVSLAPCYIDQGDLFAVHQRLSDLGFILFQLYRTRSNADGRGLWADALWVKPYVIDLLSKAK